MQTEINIKDNGRMARKKEKEIIFLRMEKNMKDNGKMTKNMEKVF